MWCPCVGALVCRHAFSFLSHGKHHQAYELTSLTNIDYLSLCYLIPLFLVAKSLQKLERGYSQIISHCNVFSGSVGISVSMCVCAWVIWAPTNSGRRYWDWVYPNCSGFQPFLLRYPITNWLIIRCYDACVCLSVRFKQGQANLNLQSPPCYCVINY